MIEEAEKETNVKGTVIPNKTVANDLLYLNHTVPNSIIYLTVFLNLYFRETKDEKIPVPVPKPSDNSTRRRRRSSESPEPQRYFINYNHLKNYLTFF